MSADKLAQANETRWQTAHLTRASEFVPVAKRLVAAKDRYLGITRRTGVPWFVIAVIHEREAAQRFDRQLGQGDPLNRVSTHDPRGRGPFKSFEDGAYDALVNCAPYAAKNKDWSIGGTLATLEKYNGLGYFYKGLPSPYVWSGTTAYHSGKYIADHVYDPNVVDTQLGCAGLLLAMMAIDSSISFGVQAPPLLDAQVPPAKSQPSISNPAPGSVGAKLVSWYDALFKRSA